MESPAFDVVVVGEINPDLILYGDVVPDFHQVEKWVDRFVLTVGSSSVIFACAAARLGLRVAFVGLCGRDFFGDFMVREMQTRGVDTRWVTRHPTLSTGLSVILQRAPDERAILTVPGTISALRAEDVPEAALKSARHLHVSSFYLQKALRPGLPGLFQKAREMGLTLSLDPNYDPEEQWRDVRWVLPYCHLFLPNRTEALAITQTSNPEEAAHRLQEMGAETVVIKMGEEGALAFTSPTGLIHVDPVRLGPVVDQVGAGDNFDAGLIYGFLQGWPLERSLRLAVACAAYSLQGEGGTGRQATLEEVMPYVAG